MLILTLFITHALAYQGPFVVQFFDQKIKVLSPSRGFNAHLTIQNKTINPIFGKIVTENKAPAYIATPPRKSSSVKLGKTNSKLIPLSPPLQEIKLQPNLGSYEIPPR